MVYLIVYYLSINLKILDFFFLFPVSFKNILVRMDAIPLLSGNRPEYLQKALSLALRVFIFIFFRCILFK